MSTMKEAAEDFLAQKRIAVVGVSRSPNQAANLIYRKLRTEGYKVFAVNPNTSEVEGDVCYPRLAVIPEQPDGVVIVTKPQVTENIVRECKELGIRRVWMHKGPDAKSASVSATAVSFCRENGITVIPGGCPMMYISHADMGHRVIRWMQGITGNLPRQV